MILTSVLHLSCCLGNIISMLYEMKPYVVNLNFGNGHFIRRLSNSSCCFSCCRNLHIRSEQQMPLLQLCHVFTLWQCLHKMESKQSGGRHMTQFDFPLTEVFESFCQEDLTLTPHCSIYTAINLKLLAGKSDKIWKSEMDVGDSM